jgi:hypothetical protein
MYQMKAAVLPGLPGRAGSGRPATSGSMTFEGRGSRRPAAMIVTLLAAAAVAAGNPPVLRGQAIDRVLAPQVTPPFQTQVLVLGTSHLSEYREVLRPEHLQRLLALLVDWAPTHVAVESLAADEIALLAELEAHDSAAAQVLDMFGRGTLTAGRTMQRVLGVDRVAAGRNARAMAAHDVLSDDERVVLTGLWELRNMRQAMHIIDIAATGGAERLLVIVGSAHKPYLDRVLATQLSVRLVQLEELVTAAR